MDGWRRRRRERMLAGLALPGRAGFVAIRPMVPTGRDAMLYAAARRASSTPPRVTVCRVNVRAPFTRPLEGHLASDGATATSNRSMRPKPYSSTPLYKFERFRILPICQAGAPAILPRSRKTKIQRVPRRGTIKALPCVPRPACPASREARVCSPFTFFSKLLIASLPGLG